MRIQYRHPKLYDLLVHKLLYPKGLWERFRREVGEGNTVFDVGAGYGYASRFVQPQNQYYGVDLNKTFVNWGRKNGIHLEIGDVFDARLYQKSDIFVVIDLVHHVHIARLKDLFDLIFSHAQKKVLVIDPGFVSIARKYGIVGKFFGWLFSRLDADGVNKIKSWLSEEEYKRLFLERFGSPRGKDFRIKQERIGGYHFVTYTRHAS